jgi:hypothetical protein
MERRGSPVLARMSLAVGMLVVLFGSGCRSFSVSCYHDADSCGSDAAPIGDAGRDMHTSGPSGDGAAADGSTLHDAHADGAADPSVDAGRDSCEYPLRDCDRSSLTGCEMNVLASGTHCGACNEHCLGGCLEGMCRTAETILSDVSPEGFGIQVENGAIYVLSADTTASVDRSVRLLRIDTKSRAQQVLLEGLSTEFDRLEAGVDRVYLRETSGKVWSIPTGTGLLTDEHIEADEIASAGEWLYYWKAGTRLMRRHTSIETSEVFELPAAEEGAEELSLKLEARRNKLWVVRNVSMTGAFSFEMFSYAPNESSRPVRTHLGAGQLDELRGSRDEVLLARLIGNASEGEATIVYLGKDGKIQPLLSALGRRDYIGYRGMAYVSYGRVADVGFHAVALEAISRVFTFGSRFILTDADVDDEGGIWFFARDPDRGLYALSRLDTKALFE